MREEKRQQKFLEKNSKKKSRQDSCASPEKLEVFNESIPMLMSDMEDIPEHESLQHDSSSQHLPEAEPICLPAKAISIRSLSEDRAFSKIFNTYKICSEEKLEN